MHIYVGKYSVIVYPLILYVKYSILIAIYELPISLNYLN